MGNDFNLEELVDYLCERLEVDINIEPTTGKPNIKKTVELKKIHYPSNNGFVFELRLEVDSLCTFREYIYYELSDMSKKEAEDKTYLRLLSATFCYGAFAAKKILEQTFQ